MTLETLANQKRALLVRGVDVEAYQSSDLYNPTLDRETKEVLRVDLVRRWSERRAVELAGK